MLMGAGYMTDEAMQDHPPSSKHLRMPCLPAGGADGGGLQGRGGGGHSADCQRFASGGAAPVGFQRGGDGRGIGVILLFATLPVRGSLGA